MGLWAIAIVAAFVIGVISANSVAFAYPAEDVEILVTTDKESYKPGEILSIKGTGAHSYSIWAKIISPQGDELIELKFLAPSSGEFSTAWIIPKSIAQGIYTIEARDVIQKTTTNFEIHSSSTELISQTPATIPNWIKKNAGWWADNLITDDDFLKGIEFLIVNEVMVIPNSDLVKTDALPGVPNWIKDTAGWWAAGKVTDSDFINGIQYLIKKGTLQVSAEVETACSGKALCITGKVERIVDGDTIHVKGYTVRISLTDTPEKYEDRYAEATAFTRYLCPVGSLAIVDQDDKQPYDQYDRLLGKVICQGKNLNEELLENGFAELSTYYCRTSEFASEAWAQKFGCGSSQPSIQESCDSAYPDFCIPPRPPDLDCIDIPTKNFTVLPPDPHRFDGDGDGLGCEG